MVQRLQYSGGTRLLLTPNHSLSWRANVRIWLALCSLSLTIAGLMSLAGAWLVLPFAGLELAALATALYLTARACRRQEVLTITPHQLQLEKGLYHKQAEWKLPRPYTRVCLRQPHTPVAAPRMFLVFREQEVALANFLNTEDAQALISILRSCGLAIDTPAPTAPALWL
ncbi:DUF2244 domain-containing protein [Marinobacter zhejiangensis]|uniref:Uncharacterized membrane protein n=1 Tax=Marinobacter zhejiangensis TaxID=488535 RepID=A0A1I4Q7M3_9GAMM|nr:DUF2244 domain-containing protein [Marinobacter zhejiangensis]SFM35640.1 Uncharacterized membrane protein [Marinobacter zhejiangensis]